MGQPIVYIMILRFSRSIQLIFSFQWVKPARNITVDILNNWRSAQLKIAETLIFGTLNYL